jgi:hypothetical protein
MPQLVKGGKHVFGWCVLSANGRLRVPPEALAEYGFPSDGEVILITGSQTSGGFGLTTSVRLAKSKIGPGLANALRTGSIDEHGERMIRLQGRTCWLTSLLDGYVLLSKPALQYYALQPGDRLLAVRGSGLAIGFICKGPIVQEAQKHPELVQYE